MSSQHDSRGDEKLHHQRSANASSRGADQSTSNSDQHASIDYQGLAAESAAATASAAMAALGQRQTRHHSNQNQHIQHQQLQLQQQQQQQQQQYAQVSKQPQVEPSTPTTDAESVSELDNSTVSQALAHINSIKNPHRIKLSTQDVKLILYLIVEIKPFKYVGNRALSQTKKWEIIQNKYYDLKFRENNDTNFIIPTVRTLQRQLAGAVKKAQKQRGKERAGGFDRTHTIPQTLPEIDADDYYNFRHISPNSPQEELESALLDLHELSDKIKELKSQSNNLVKVSYQPRTKTLTGDAFNDDENGIPRRGGGSGAVSTADTRDATSHLEEISNVLSHRIFNLKQELENDSTIPPKQKQTFELLESVFNHTNEMRGLVAQENEALNKQINKLISNHLEKIERVRSQFNVQQLESIEKITDLFKEDFKQAGKSKTILEKLDSIKELLK
ncbi:hypothetical protein CORT_0E06180 [Candida orthopsilosis Co 90-125]|uniref:Uncharacterized protein n=1 Tax=Candida orthopsilosis (strain 90-125) TaxID=1136231 RepID=H8X8A1_CANO9|nr:hypothetical protein CORT_0E06180 [Candida orthopsilosis Co 90-125]CCG24200.1 hypothetical protein CORT_0E06180 [Candida orthopsilosis Co 90-125]